MRISVNYGPMDSTFTGTWAEDGESFSGGWRPNLDADEAINVAYDIGGSRIFVGHSCHRVAMSRTPEDSGNPSRASS